MSASDLQRAQEVLRSWVDEEGDIWEFRRVMSVTQRRYLASDGWSKWTSKKLCGGVPGLADAIARFEASLPKTKTQTAPEPHSESELYVVRAQLAAALEKVARLEKSLQSLEEADWAGKNCGYCGGPMFVENDEVTCASCGASDG